MTSVRQAAEDYLAMRRSLGYAMKQDGKRLLEFVSFLERSGHAQVTTDAARSWATMAPTMGSAARRLSVVRTFTKFLHAIDPRTEIPPQDLLPYSTSRKTPYVYSDDDVCALIRATRTLQGRLRPATYATLFGMLATSGMRVGEATGIDRPDFDAHEGVLTVRGSVRGSKGKSRRVYLHATARDALQAYARERDRAFPCPNSPSFLLSTTGKRLLRQDVHGTFLILLGRAGLANRKPRRPRIHDLRHSFAIHTLEDWYRDGVDVERSLPRLSTYLGHGGPASTYWYLSATPEPLALAAERLGRLLGPMS